MSSTSLQPPPDVEAMQAEDVALENVVQPFPLGQRAERALESRLCEPPHALRIVSCVDK